VARVKYSPEATLMELVKLDTRRITDWPTFHEVFAEIFGFPDYYGRNMNAWIDCMTDLDALEGSMTSVHVEPGQIVALQLEHVGDLRQRFGEAYDAIIECSAFVNWRRIEMGDPPVLVLSFYA
jgi:RNAse (barnase) inhibitor barstar